MCGVTTIHISSKSEFSTIWFAIIKWPIWIGLKVPKYNPIFFITFFKTSIYFFWEASFCNPKKLSTKLEKASVKVGAKVGEEGKIFGSVTTIQVAEQLVAAGFEVERKNVTIKDSNIKTTGKYKATVKLHKEVSVEIEFEVVEG